jgi:hypothetical protein
MKLHVHLKTGDIAIDEVVEGNGAEEIVAAVQRRVVQEAPFLVAAVIKRMSPLAFAQEATRRYNTATKQTLPIPTTCDEFVKMGVEKNFATLVES